LIDPQLSNGIRILVAKEFPDERGSLLQSWVKRDLEAAGIHADFQQAIESRSKRGVVRGLHFQWAPPMGKLLRCIRGSVLDVVVDVRHGSPTLGHHLKVLLSGENRRIIWVPPGFAHGFMALEDESIVLYECTAPHGPSGEGGILWNDSGLGIEWPDIPPIVSEKDRRMPTLRDWLSDPRSRSFRYESPECA
jgi:dTDP-4-dehydrorhamnose 3,5-epimerase